MVITDIEGFTIHKGVTRQIRASFQDPYMRRWGKISSCRRRIFQYVISDESGLITYKCVLFNSTGVMIYNHSINCAKLDCILALQMIEIIASRPKDKKNACELSHTDIPYCLRNLLTAANQIVRFSFTIVNNFCLSTFILWSILMGIFYLFNMNNTDYNISWLRGGLKHSSKPCCYITVIAKTNQRVLEKQSGYLTRGKNGHCHSWNYDSFWVFEYL